MSVRTTIPVQQTTAGRAAGRTRSAAANHPRAALLVGTALGTALLSLTYGASPALAVCSPSGTGNKTATASDCAPNTGINASTTGGNITVNVNANLNNTSGNGITADANNFIIGGSITLNPSGTRTVTGSTNGSSSPPT